jgi:hypothetical protein
MPRGGVKPAQMEDTMKRFLSNGLLGVVVVAAVIAGCGGEQTGSEAAAPQYAAERITLETNPRPSPAPAAGGSAASGDASASESSGARDASASERAASAP